MPAPKSWLVPDALTPDDEPMMHALDENGNSRNLKTVSVSHRTNLDRSQALELADYLGHPDRLAYQTGGAEWAAHITYARRAAIALATNDLRAALRSAEIATEALRLYEQLQARSP